MNVELRVGIITFTINKRNIFIAKQNSILCSKYIVNINIEKYNIRGKFRLKLKLNNMISFI